MAIQVVRDDLEFRLIQESVSWHTSFNFFILSCYFMSYTCTNEEYLCFRRLGIAYGLGFILLSIFLVIVLLVSEHPTSRQGINRVWFAVAVRTSCCYCWMLSLQFLTFHIPRAVRAAVWIACLCRVPTGTGCPVRLGLPPPWGCAGLWATCSGERCPCL